LTTVAWAQQAPPVRIRGTIEAVDGSTLSIKTREGSDVKVKMTDNVAAFAVHIFPENQRGAAEGFRPWDARANSTMTNATVAETVKGTDGQNITVKYKDGEKKVV